MLGPYAIATAALEALVPTYAHICACEFDHMNLPNAYNNNASLRGSLDLDLLMCSIRRRYLHRLLDRHFGLGVLMTTEL